MVTQESNFTMDETQTFIVKALKKIGAISEKEICRYLPGDKGGYIHHFTLKKIRKTKPAEFCALIQEFIINPATPRQIEPKPRIRRNKSLSLKEIDLKHILKLAQKTGDTYLLSKLGTRFSLQSIKKQLIKSIKQNKVDEELWNSYIQALKNPQQN